MSGNDQNIAEIPYWEPARTSKVVFRMRKRVAYVFHLLFAVGMQAHPSKYTTHPNRVFLPVSLSVSSGRLALQ